MTEQQMIALSAALVPIAALGVRMLAKMLGEVAHEKLPPEVAESLTKQRGEKPKD